MTMQGSMADACECRGGVRGEVGEVFFTMQDIYPLVGCEINSLGHCRTF